MEAAENAQKESNDKVKTIAELYIDAEDAVASAKKNLFEAEIAIEKKNNVESTTKSITDSSCSQNNRFCAKNIIFNIIIFGLIFYLIYVLLIEKSNNNESVIADNLCMLDIY